MTHIIVYYNPECQPCAQQAKHTARMDWLNRIQFSTKTSPLGLVPKGEIFVQDVRTNKILKGIYATQKICLNVPLFYLYGILLYISPIRKLMERRPTPCKDDACE